MGLLQQIETIKNNVPLVYEAGQGEGGGSTMAKISSVNLLASAWEGGASPYSQVVTIEGTTENSKVDLNPSVEQLNIFHNKDISFVPENVDGVITVFCLGQKPTMDYNIQVTITEVV